MKSRLDVFRIDAQDISSLYSILASCLASRGLGSNSPRFDPLTNVFTLIHQLGARCAILQKNVQDPDFIEEHAAYYSRWTGTVPRYCDRLHFFSEEATSDDPLAVIDQMAGSQDVYIGFVTIRPISMAPIAATIIKPRSLQFPSYLLSKETFAVNLAGQRFEICGTPFMQQDNAVGACAQASIWMALRTLQKREGQAAFSPAQITNAATRFLVEGRTLPNRGGLTIQQVSEAVRASGYSPHTLSLRDLSTPASPSTIKKMKRVIYPYVESGIPVLLLLFPDRYSGHAVTLIGHGWDEAPPQLTELKRIPAVHWTNPIRIFDASSWASPFIIHNDNTGPYLPLPETHATEYCLAHAGFAIPLLHPNVFVDGEEAQLCCLRLLQTSLENLFAPEITVAGQTETTDPPRVVLRTYLQDRADFRTSIMHSNAPEDVKKYYRLKWLPKRIWVSELNHLDDYGRAPTEQAMRLGEILLDPAAEAEDGAFLSIRLCGELLPPSARGIEGILLDRDALTGEISASPISGLGLSPLVRDTM